MTLQQKVLGVFGFALLVLLAIGYASYRSVAALAESAGPAGRAQGSQAVLIVLLGSAASILLLLLAAVMVRRDITERYRAEQDLQQSEQRLQAFLDNAAAVIYMKDLEGRYFLINQEYVALAGRSMPEILGKTAEEIYPPEFAEKLRENDRRVLESGQPVEFEETVPKGEATVTYLSVKFPLRDNDGKIYALCGISTDISDRKRAERELRHAHEQLTRSMAELQQRTQDITRLGEMGELLQSCQSQTEAYQVVARFLPQLFPLTVGALYTINSSRNLVESVTAWGGSVAGENVFSPEDCWALRRGRMHAVAKLDYGQRCNHVPASGLSGYLCIPLLAQGEGLGVLHLRVAADPAAQKTPSLLFTDSGRRLANAVGEQIALAIANLRLRETLRQQSIRDGLTGLYNRRFLEESLERELRRAARSQHPLAVLMIDLDHFKRFNDTFGHDAGDALLRELGSLLQSHVRGSDIACRYGGEEFAVILPDAPIAAAQERADLIRKSAKHLDTRHHGQALGAITLSVGVAVFPDHGDAPFTLLRTADQALYRAKAAGRDCVVLAETPAPTTPSPS
jgi:diguanylate cyclase (GGDEF)-like protein/PAS domain S-box-containing protein